MREIITALMAQEGTDGEAAERARRAMARLEANPRYAGYFGMQRELGAWLPAYHPADAVIGRAEDGALVLHGVACYPWGFAFTIASVPRPGIEGPRAFRMERGGINPAELMGPLPAAMRHALGREFPDPVPPPELHVGFADGSRFRVIDIVDEMVDRAQAKTSALEDWGADQRYVRSTRGSRMEGAAVMTVVGWKLPPPGPVTVEVEWRAHGVPLSLHILDGVAISRAAQRAHPRAVFD